MVSLIGKVIAGWKLQGLIKCTPQMSIYRVCSKDDESSKFCMSIIYKDSDNPDFINEEKVDFAMDINVNVRPEFVYHDSHCFPIIPLKNTWGKYNDHEFFVFERISKPLNNIITKDTHISHDDFVNIACQIFDILDQLFKKNKILKNLDIKDFCLRRTTNGYRVVLINQDFYTETAFDIDEPTFTSVSVMKGNEPTMRDNVISAVYIMLYLLNGSLPWSSLSTDEMLSKKMDDELIDSLVMDDFEWCLALLKKYNLHSNQPVSLEEQIAKLRATTQTRHITFGTVLSKYANKRKIPSVTEKNYYDNPVIEKDEETQQVEEIIKQVEQFEQFEEDMDDANRANETIENIEQVEDMIKEVEEFEKFEEEMDDEESEKTPDLSDLVLPKVDTTKRDQPSDEYPVIEKRVRVGESSRRSFKNKAKSFLSSATFSNILMVSAVTVASMMGV